MEFQMKSCDGCKTCELACSFHHRGEFRPTESSLKIADTPTADGYGVKVFEESSGLRPGCDECEGLDVPLCVAFCWVGEDLKEIIDQYSQRLH